MASGKNEDTSAPLDESRIDNNGSKTVRLCETLMQRHGSLLNSAGNPCIKLDALTLILDTINQHCHDEKIGSEIYLHIVKNLDLNGNMSIDSRVLSDKVGVPNEMVDECLRHLHNIHGIQIKK